MKSKFTLFDLVDYVVHLHEMYPVHNQFFIKLTKNLAERLRHNDYQSLFDEEMTQLRHYRQQFPELKELLEVYNTLREAYVRFLVGQFVFDISQFHQQANLIRSYLYIIESPIALDPLKEKIQQRLTQIAGQTVSQELHFLKQALNLLTDQEKNETIKTIWDAYNQIEKSLSELSISPQAKQIYTKYQQPSYRVQQINQAYFPALGASNGVCYGLAAAMTLAAYNPFLPENRFKTLQLTREINSFQHKQDCEADDQQIFKRRALSCLQVCPNLLQQAEAIVELAALNKGKHLLLSFEGRGKHSCYIKMVANNEIHYMDSKHGAYCFQKTEEFIEFHLASHLIFPPSSHPRRYQLYELCDAPENPDFGNYIAYLTGPNYFDSFYILASQIFHLLLGGVILGGDFSYLNAAIFSVLYLVALNSRLQGLLAIPNYFKDQLGSANLESCETYLTKQLTKSENSIRAQLSFFGKMDKEATVPVPVTVSVPVTGFI